MSFFRLAVVSVSTLHNTTLERSELKLHFPHRYCHHVSYFLRHTSISYHHHKIAPRSLSRTFSIAVVSCEIPLDFLFFAFSFLSDEESACNVLIKSNGEIET